MFVKFGQILSTRADLLPPEFCAELGKYRWTAASQVHPLIEKAKRRFPLTGSSARKLRSGGANLLAGRAWEANLFPLVSAETPDFDLDRYLRYGGLPQAYASADPEEELPAYVSTYLQEEIQAETVREYFSVLDDTLVGFIVEPWRESRKRKAIETAKFYFFDTGVTHALAGTEFLERNSDLYGRSFEQWVGMELRAYLSYRRSRHDPHFWRTVNGQEVDFVVGDRCAIEVKASRKVTARDLRGLKALAEEEAHRRYVCASHDPVDRQAGRIAAARARRRDRPQAPSPPGSGRTSWRPLPSSTRG